ncbi:DNA-directed RNA polymerase subunit omega, partial [Bacillus velezensis]
KALEEIDAGLLSFEREDSE